MNRSLLRSLVSHYKGSVPRYTSYPTAVEFTNNFGSEQWKRVQASDDIIYSDKVTSDTRPEKPLSVYIHIPFCHKLCFFCACNKLISSDYGVVAPYIKALEAEAGTYASERQIKQFHLGGGTPNYLRPGDLKHLIKTVQGFFGSPVSEYDYSMEVDPRTTISGHLEAARECGFNRVSMGVQDFDPLVQKTINREQPIASTRKLIEQARALGFGGINIDLIYGLPNQTEQGFSKTLQEIKAIRPDRIALYGYAHVTWLHKVQKSFHRARLPSPEERAELFMLATEELLDAGYKYIGLDHFALEGDSLSIAQKKGTLNRNFMGYTTHKAVDIVGLGASAISSTQSAFAQNYKNLSAYYEGVTAGGATERGLHRSFEDAVRADVIEQILCNGVVDLDNVCKAWGLGSDFFEQELSEMAGERAEVVTVQGRKLELSETGRLFSRNIASHFDQYLRSHSGTKKFSQAV